MRKILPSSSIWPPERMMSYSSRMTLVSSLGVQPSVAQHGGDGVGGVRLVGEELQSPEP